MNSCPNWSSAAFSSSSEMLAIAGDYDALDECRKILVMCTSRCAEKSTRYQRPFSFGIPEQVLLWCAPSQRFAALLLTWKGMQYSNVDACTREPSPRTVFAYVHN
jgi:hypothetical protein